MADQTTLQQVSDTDKSLNQELKAHHRDLRRYIWLPVILGVVLIVGVVVISLALGRAGTSGIADIMLSFLCLLPMIICLFPVYLILIVSIVLLTRVKSPINRGLQNVHQKTDGLEHSSKRLFDSLARKAADFNIKMASLDAVFGVFERFNAQDDQTGRK